MLINVVTNVEMNVVKNVGDNVVKMWNKCRINCRFMWDSNPQNLTPESDALPQEPLIQIQLDDNFTTGICR